MTVSVAAEWAVLTVAGAAAGAVNTVAGGGSLISFPALVALGYSPLVANVTNAVATVPGYAGGCVGLREELADQGPVLLRLGLVVGVGALAGSAVLMALPPASFQRVVGWLVLGSVLLMVVQPRLRRAVVSRAQPGVGEPGPRWRPGAYATQFVVAVYGGYFAAGLGILMLAALGVTQPDTLHRLNALKSALSLVVGVVSAVFFALTAPIAWVPALILAFSSLLGGLAGARLAKSISPELLRRSVIVAGLAAALLLLTRN